MHPQVPWGLKNNALPRLLGACLARHFMPNLLSRVMQPRQSESENLRNANPKAQPQHATCRNMLQPDLIGKIDASQYYWYCYSTIVVVIISTTIIIITIIIIIITTIYTILAIAIIIFIVVVIIIITIKNYYFAASRL